MELILRLKDESKLDALLDALRHFISAEGAELAVESLERRAVLDTVPNGSDDAKWNELMSRDKLRPGQPPMTEEEEAEFINQAIKETRAAMRAGQNAEGRL